jgi:uncharacterized membrane protein
VKINLKRDIPLLFITLLAIILRWRLIYVFEYWYDEAITGLLMYAKSHEFWSVVLHENTPPLYYLFVKVWSLVFGINDVSIRIPTLIFGVLTVILVYLTARKFFSVEVSYLAGALAAINPFLIAYSVEARTYALYGLLTLLAFYLFLDKKDKLFVLTVILLSVTQYLSAFFVFILCLCWFFRNTFIDKKGFKYVFLHMLPVGAAYIYAYIKVKEQNLAAQNIGWVRPATFWNIARSAISYIFGIKSKMPGADSIVNFKFQTVNLDVVTIGAVLFFLFILGLIYVLYKERKVEYYLTTCLLFLPQFLLIVLYKLSIYRIYVERYLFPCSLFFILLVAVILSKLSRFISWGIVVSYFIFMLLAVKPEYYVGMRNLYNIYNKFPYDIAFTSAADYTIGKYYFRNGSNVKLYDPQDPGNTYRIWELIPGDFQPTDLNTALLISPEPQRIPDGYKKVSESGNYSAYSKVQ